MTASNLPALGFSGLVMPAFQIRLGKLCIVSELSHRLVCQYAHKRKSPCNGKRSKCKIGDTGTKS